MKTFTDLLAEMGLSYCPEFPNTRCNHRDKWKDPFCNYSGPPFEFETSERLLFRGCSQAQEITGLAFWGPSIIAN